MLHEKSKTKDWAEEVKNHFCGDQLDGCVTQTHAHAHSWDTVTPRTEKSAFPGVTSGLVSQSVGKSLDDVCVCVETELRNI